MFSTDLQFSSFYSSMFYLYYLLLFSVSPNSWSQNHVTTSVLIILAVSWSEPYPVLSKKRPTANLVSRKVLAPLLGQMIICILIQASSLLIVQEQEWYVSLSQDN